VSDFYHEYARPDLFERGVDDLPILRSDALKYVVLFRNQLRPDFLVQCMSGAGDSPSIVRLLSSNYVILHHYVAYALDRLLLVKDTAGRVSGYSGCCGRML